MTSDVYLKVFIFYSARSCDCPNTERNTQGHTINYLISLTNCIMQWTTSVLQKKFACMIFHLYCAFSRDATEYATEHLECEVGCNLGSIEWLVCLSVCFNFWVAVTESVAVTMNIGVICVVLIINLTVALTDWLSIKLSHE